MYAFLTMQQLVDLPKREYVVDPETSECQVIADVPFDVRVIGQDPSKPMQQLVAVLSGLEGFQIHFPHVIVLNGIPTSVEIYGESIEYEKQHQN